MLCGQTVLPNVSAAYSKWSVFVSSGSLFCFFIISCANCTFVRVNQTSLARFQPKTMELSAGVKCEIGQMSNERNSHFYQIQLSRGGSLPITARMLPSGPSWSCNKLHHPTSWDRNPFQHRVLTVLSAAAEREREPLSGLLLTCCSHCSGEGATLRGGGDYIQRFLWALYHMQPWNLILQMCRLQKPFTRYTICICWTWEVSGTWHHLLNVYS